MFTVVIWGKWALNAILGYKYKFSTHVGIGCMIFFYSHKKVKSHWFCHIITLLACKTVSTAAATSIFESNPQVGNLMFVHAYNVL